MSDSVDRARSYLEGKPLKVGYFIYRNGLASNTSIYEQEFPDFIPNSQDIVYLDHESYIVTSRHYLPEENKIVLLVQLELEYLNDMKHI
jgi:hypothetical protein